MAVNDFARGGCAIQSIRFFAIRISRSATGVYRPAKQLAVTIESRFPNALHRHS